MARDGEDRVGRVRRARTRRSRAARRRSRAPAPRRPTGRSSIAAEPSKPAPSTANAPPRGLTPPGGRHEHGVARAVQELLGRRAGHDAPEPAAVGRAHHDQVGVLLVGQLVQPARRRDRGVDARLPGRRTLRAPGRRGCRTSSAASRRVRSTTGSCSQRRDERDVERRDVGDDEPAPGDPRPAGVRGRRASSPDSLPSKPTRMRGRVRVGLVVLMAVIVPPSPGGDICSGC